MYFAGHGLPVDGGRDAVLLAADGDPSRPEETGYRLSTLYANLKSFGVKRLRFYIDASFNRDLAVLPVKGAADPWSVSVFPATDAVGTAARNWVVVTAAKGDQPAYAAPSEPLSAFADALLKGLGGQADEAGAGNNDGMISAAELLDYVVPAVNAEVNRATGGVQSPALHGRPQEILRYLRGAPPPTAKQPVAVEQTSERPQKASVPSTPPAQPAQPSEFRQDPPDPSAAAVQPEQPSEFRQPPPKQPEQQPAAASPAPTPQPKQQPAAAPPAPAPQPQPAPARPINPSFDCNKARTPAEKTICSSPDMAVLDSRMAELYYARRRALRGGQRNALTRSQRAWLGRRNACKSDLACLIGVYRKRIQELQ